MTKEIITETANLTPSLLADALTELAGAAASIALSRGSISRTGVGAAAAEEAAAGFNCPSVLVHLAVDYFLAGRAALESVAALGLAENDMRLIQLGYEHMARFSPERVLAAELPARFHAVRSADGNVMITWPGGVSRPWATAARQRLLSLEPAPLHV